MGIAEAERDGIKYYYDKAYPCRGSHGSYVYLVPCEQCGTIVERITYSGNSEVLCLKCRAKQKKAKQEIQRQQDEAVETKHMRRYKQALIKIQGQVPDFAQYRKAVNIAAKAVEKYGSVPEAMVAIELVRLGYAFIPQQKIGRYHVDFFVPKNKFVIEVDGETFHRNTKYSDREATIQISLGFDVKIIHVSAELISKNIQKLGRYIQKALELP